MKKILAIFCSLAIFSVSLFSTGIFTTPASAEGEATEERFFHSFATAADYETSKKYVNASGTNITLSYDETEGALKAVPTTPGKNNHQVRIDPVQGPQTVKIDDYPVVAVKIKFNNSATPRFGGVNIGTNKAMRPSGSTDSVFSTLQLAGTGKTGDWQLLIWDGESLIYDAADSTTSKNFCGTYEAFICMLTDNGQTTTADDIYWIQWAGAFKTVEEVYEYEQDMVSPYFYDFTNQKITEETIATDSANRRVTVGANTTMSYDATEGALKIDAVDGATTAGQFNPMPYLDKNTKVAEYPVVAFKVKVNNTARSFDRLFVGTTGRTVSGGNYNNDLGVMSNKATGGWQLIIIDGTDLVYNAADGTGNTWFDGTYGNMIIKLMADSTTATADDIWWVKWAGVFKSVDDVYAYDGSPNTPFFYDFTEEDNVAGLTASGMVKTDNNGTGNNMTFAYDETNEALKVIPVASSTANRFIVTPANTTNVTEYPVVAIKLKVANASKNFGGIAPAPKHGVSGGSTFPYGYAAGANLRESGDWQTIVFDMKKLADQTYVTGTWNSLLVAALANNVSAAATDYLYVQWIGTFKSEADAYAYDREAPASFLYNYTEKMNNGTGNIGFAMSELGGSVGYSAEYTALKATPADATVRNHRLQFLHPSTSTTNANDRIKVADYPVIAVKIRANVATNLTTWAGTYGVNDSGTRTKGSMFTDYDKMTNAKQVTDDWQILTFNYTEKIPVYLEKFSSTVQYWDNIYLLLTPDSTAAPEGQEWDIQWFGIFDSEESAYAYDEVYFEGVSKKDTAKPADEDTNVLFVGDDASAQLLNAEVKDILGDEDTNVNLGFLGAADFGNAVAKGTDNMQFTYMAKNNKLTYTDAKTNSDAVQDFADWDYVFVQAGDTTAELVASAGTHLVTNGKAVAYTAATNADTSSAIAGVTEAFDLNGMLYKAATKYATADYIYAASGLTSAGNKLAALTLCDYLIADYKALDKNVTVYDASEIIDTLIKASIDLALAGDADENSVIEWADVDAVRAQILGAAATDNADTDLNGNIDIIDAVRVAVFLG